jgi:hypothetical protein
MLRTTKIALTAVVLASIAGCGSQKLGQGDRVNNEGQLPLTQQGALPGSVPPPGASNPPAAVPLSSTTRAQMPNGLAYPAGQPPVSRTTETTTLVKETPMVAPVGAPTPVGTPASSNITATETTTRKTAYLPPPHHVYRREVHYRKNDKIHVARATKHTIGFATKLPFRLRP